MYDDILGPVEEEIEINIKPKRKKNALKANKGTTLKANLAPKVLSPNVTDPVKSNKGQEVCDEDEEDDICEECGKPNQDCDCELLDDLLELHEDEDEDNDEDPWDDVDGNEGEEKCDNG